MLAKKNVTMLRSRVSFLLRRCLTPPRVVPLAAGTRQDFVEWRVVVLNGAVGGEHVLVVQRLAAVGVILDKRAAVRRRRRRGFAIADLGQRMSDGERARAGRARTDKGMGNR